MNDYTSYVYTDNQNVTIDLLKIKKDFRKTLFEILS